MVSNKSDILKILSNNYPNFLKKDLSKFFDIVLNEIQYAINRRERVELRDNFTLEAKIQKQRIARNPKTNEKITVQEKKLIKFKMSKIYLSLSCFPYIICERSYLVETPLSGIRPKRCFLAVYYILRCSYTLPFQ